MNDGLSTPPASETTTLRTLRSTTDQFANNLSDSVGTVVCTTLRTATSQAVDTVQETGRKEVDTVQETGRKEVDTVQETGRKAVDTVQETGRKTRDETTRAIQDTARKVAKETTDAIQEIKRDFQTTANDTHAQILLDVTDQTRSVHQRQTLAEKAMGELSDVVTGLKHEVSCIRAHTDDVKAGFAALTNLQPSPLHQNVTGVSVEEKKNPKTTWTTWTTLSSAYSMATTLWSWNKTESTTTYFDYFRTGFQQMLLRIAFVALIGLVGLIGVYVLWNVVFTALLNTALRGVAVTIALLCIGCLCWFRQRVVTTITHAGQFVTRKVSHLAHALYAILTLPFTYAYKTAVGLCKTITLLAQALYAIITWPFRQIGRAFTCVYDGIRALPQVCTQVGSRKRIQLTLGIFTAFLCIIIVGWTLQQHDSEPSLSLSSMFGCIEPEPKNVSLACPSAPNHTKSVPYHFTREPGSDLLTKCRALKSSSVPRLMPLWKTSTPTTYVCLSKPGMTPSREHFHDVSDTMEAEAIRTLRLMDPSVFGCIKPEPTTANITAMNRNMNTFSNGLHVFASYAPFVAVAYFTSTSKSP